MREEIREIERFRARGENGYETTIIILQRFHYVRTMSQPDALVPGMKTIRTEDGFACNFKDERTFEVVNDPLHPAQIVRRVS